MLSDKKRILFVDDEQNLLQGLKRMLRSKKFEWDIAVANSGQEALDQLAREPFDVVVSDMRMPGMDGAELLKRVSLQYPLVVRIILSGQSDRTSILKSVPHTHQFLSKPCDADELKRTLDRTFALREILEKQALRKIVSQLHSIPSLPAIYDELTEAMQSPDVTMTKVGEIIARDIAMTTKILQMVNSAFFGLQVEVSSPIHAAKLLGAPIIQALVVSVGIFSKFDSSKVAGLSLEALIEHSFRVANFAKVIARHEGKDQEFCENAFISGMLHDLGKLVLAHILPRAYTKILTLSKEEDLPVYESERQVLETTHAEVGAYLVGMWGLPDVLVEALAFHHNPAASQTTHFSPLAAVHIANALEHHDATEVDASEPPLVSQDYLNELALTEKLPALYKICCDTNDEEGAYA